MKTKLRNIYCRKTGSNYIVLRIPVKLFEKLPERFFMDLDIESLRYVDFEKKEKKK